MFLIIVVILIVNIIFIKNQEHYLVMQDYLFPTIGFDGWLYNCSQSSAPNFRSTALGDLTKKIFGIYIIIMTRQTLMAFISVCKKK